MAVPYIFVQGTAASADEVNANFRAVDNNETILENSINIVKLQYCQSVTDIDHDYMVVDVFTDSTGYNNSVCTADTTSYFLSRGLNGYYANHYLVDNYNTAVCYAQSGGTVTINNTNCYLRQYSTTDCAHTYNCSCLNGCLNGVDLKDVALINFKFNYCMLWVRAGNACLLFSDDTNSFYICNAGTANDKSMKGYYEISYYKTSACNFDIYLTHCVLYSTDCIVCNPEFALTCCGNLDISGTGTFPIPKVKTHVYKGPYNYWAYNEWCLEYGIESTEYSETKITTVETRYDNPVATTYLTNEQVGSGTVVYNVLDASDDSCIACNLELNTHNLLTCCVCCHKYEIIQCSDGFSCVKSYALVAGEA